MQVVEPLRIEKSMVGGRLPLGKVGTVGRCV